MGGVVDGWFERVAKKVGWWFSVVDLGEEGRWVSENRENSGEQMVFCLFFSKVLISAL